MKKILVCGLLMMGWCTAEAQTSIITFLDSLTALRHKIDTTQITGNNLSAYSQYQLFAPATIVQILGKHWGNMLAYGIMVIFAVALWPLVIRKACRSEKIAADKATEAETVKA